MQTEKERALELRLIKAEERIAKLEKHSHPPIDLTPLVRAEIAHALKEQNDGQ